MDDRRFDALARALGGAATRRSALGALLGLGLAGAAGHDATAKKKRRKCDPACAAGQTCDQGACRCTNGGAVCGASCCTSGQRCENGQCVTPPRQCIAAGEACKGVGRTCCAGTVCASGQGGQHDVACRVPAGGACERTADCVFDSECKDGRCIANERPRPDEGQTCIPAGLSGCTDTADCCPGSDCLTQVGASSGTCTAPAACTVCPSGCPYSTIEAAIAGSPSGATITIAPGTYAPVGVYNNAVRGWVYLDVNNTSLTLKSCDPQRTVTVSCPDKGYQIYCMVATGGARLELQGFALEGTSGTGLYAGTGSQVTIADVSFTGFPIGLGTTGVKVSVGAGVSFVSCGAGGLGAGLWAFDSSNEITCTATPTYTSTSPKCLTVSDPACGC